MNRKIVKSRFFFEQDMMETVGEVPAETPEPWGKDARLNVVGKPVERLDGYEKVSGTATYTFDVRLPHMAHARTLRSPHPHARIRSIDTSRALNMDGVLDILTHENTPDIPWYRDSSRLFDPHLRYEGDEVACVVAETEAIANRALDEIRVDYEVLPFSVDHVAGREPDAPVLHGESNVTTERSTNRGDIAAGKLEADVVLERTFRTQVIMHNPTEVHCSVVNWEGDKLTVWDSTQAVYWIQGGIAAALKIPASHLRVIKKYMGGGFGSKLTTGKYTVMAALLARRIGRPVRIALDRREMQLCVGNRPDSEQHLMGACKKDGTLMALRHESYGAAGAYPYRAGCSWPLRTLYKCENVEAYDHSVYINAGPGRPLRAPGHVQGTFGLESLMDELAESIGMDPLEFRTRNMTDRDQVMGLPYTSKFLKEAYEAGAKAIGWKDRKAPGADTGPIQTGMGMASQIWWGGGGPPANATLKLNRDGSLRILAGTQDIGTGTYTILAQVAAEVLEIPVDNISVTLGDTATTPYCPGSGGSMTAPSVTPAVRDAAEQLKARLISGAAAVLEVPETALRYEKGRVTPNEKPENAMSISDIIGKLREQTLIATGSRNANPEGYALNTFGAQFARVSVDTRTGRIIVNRIVGAYDIGRVMNQRLMENQVHGGIIQGLSYALMEERLLDRNTGKMLTTDLHDYKIATIHDTPEIEVIVVSNGDTKISSTGVKGVGEPAIIPTPGAIANAVYNALGVRIRELPMTPDRVLAALHRENGGQS